MTDTHTADNCVFCRIARGELPAAKVFEDEHTLAIMDIQSVNPGHMLVLVKPHRANVYALEDELAGAVFRTAARMARAAKKAFGCQGVTLLQANERPARRPCSISTSTCCRAGKATVWNWPGR